MTNLTRLTVSHRGLSAPPAWVYGASTRINNCYELGCELLYQNQIYIPPACDEFQLSRKTTAFKKNKFNFFKLKIQKFSDEKVFYDARNFFNGNIAHLTQYHLTSLAILCMDFSISEENVGIIFSKKDGALGYELFSKLGFNCLITDQNINAPIFQSPINDDNFFHYMRKAKNFANGIFPQIPADGKYFIPRKGTRKLINELDVGNFLKLHGYEKLYLEDLSISEQMDKWLTAKSVVAIHGAGLGWMPFSLASKFSLVELFPSGFVVNPFRKSHAVMYPGSLWRGIRGVLDWRVVKKIDSSHNFKKFAFDDFQVDLKSLALALKDIED
ncbi:glycosyltransferase 61 family protein [Comamonas badia]|uniref:glycosyltransferase 61 family protein n=1 Tax=Comamonas badia TaxID=265291 RepID=UPI0009FCC4D4|nr:glycosyltransferase family 61 protein [Comamonas badia]